MKQVTCINYKSIILLIKGMFAYVYAIYSQVNRTQGSTIWYIGYLIPYISYKIYISKHELKFQIIFF